MQLRRKTKRFAALVLAMSMALGCMPVGAWAETTTPTDLPPIIATDGEAVPEPTLPSDEREAEKGDDAPALRIRYILVKQVIISKACRIVLNTWDIIPVPAADTSIH